MKPGDLVRLVPGYQIYDSLVVRHIRDDLFILLEEFDPDLEDSSTIFHASGMKVPVFLGEVELVQTCK